MKKREIKKEIKKVEKMILELDAKETWTQEDFILSIELNHDLYILEQMLGEEK